MDKLRVLEVVGVMNRGGAESMLMSIFRYTHDKIDYTFLVNDSKDNLGRKGAYDDEIIKLGGRILYIARQGASGPFKYIKDFKKIVNEVQPDLVHSHLNAKSGFISLAARIALVKHVVVHSHADIKFKGNILQRFTHEVELFLQKILISLFATDFWGCSVAANKRLYFSCVRRKSCVINNAIDADCYINYCVQHAKEIKESYALSGNSLVLGNVGRIVSHKNVAFIINVIDRLQDMGQSAVLVIAGREDDRDYINTMKKNASRLNLENNLIMLGDRNDIPEVLASFDVFVGTSFSEGFGLVAVESQAVGLPTILSRGFPDSADLGMGNVTFIPDYNPKRWAEAIVKQKENKITDKEYISKALQDKGFDAKINSTFVMSLYYKIADRK